MTNAKKLTAREVYELLLAIPIENQIGKIEFEMSNVKFSVKSKDIVGGVIQEWVENWLTRQKILFSKPENSQDWPDLILGSGEDLEIKVFNYDASPAFDLGNFRAYLDSLVEFPNRVFDKHLVFGYSTDEVTGQISIRGLWLKHIWELTGPSEKNILELQVKKGVPYNLRPKKFYSNNISVFQNHLEFLTALSKAIDKFEIYKESNGKEWLFKVNQKIKS
jgi:hypothetical protein